MKREPYWDVLKFVLIILVIFGHTLYLNIPKDSLNMALFNTIYAFHMPLFVFISGRFSQLNDKKRYSWGILRLAESFIIFTILHILFRYYILSSSTSLFKKSYLLYPEETMWYLQCLIYWRILITIIPPQILKNKYEIIGLSVIVGLFGGFIPLQYFSFQRALCFFPFFLLGFYSPKNVTKCLKDVPIPFRFIFIIAIGVAFYCFFPSSLERIFTGQYKYANSISVLYRFIFYILATSLSFSVMRLLIMPYFVNSFLAKLGKETLFLYLYHWFFVQLVAVTISHKLITGTTAQIIACTLAIVFILMALTKCMPLRWLLNPVMSIVRK